MGRIFVYTFNVATLTPSSDHAALYKLSKDTEDNVDADIWAVALQEIPTLEITGVSSKGKTWLHYITEIMHGTRKCVLIHYHYMLSNLLMVFGDLNFASFIQKIEIRSIKHALGGTLGYKGTTGTRMLLRNGVDLVFITSHLSHGANNLEARVRQCEQGKICTFDDCEDAAEKKIVLWFGDLNFRVENGLTDNCFTLHEGTKMEFKLDEYEQLTKLKLAGRIFEDYDEAPIRFPPSYRFRVGTSLYDRARDPSWCDRVLVKASNCNYKCLSYNLDSSVRVSDHLPVFAHLEMPDLFDCSFMLSNVCSFQNIPAWTCSVYFMCTFSFTNKYYETDGSNMDWVGFYRLPMRAISEPDYWIYMALCYESPVLPSQISSNPQSDTNSGTLFSNSKSYVAEYSSLSAGQYVAAYFSSKYKVLLGVSNAFHVTHSG